MNSNTFWRMFLVVYAVLFLKVSSVYSQREFPEGLDEYVNSVCKRFEVPGMAIAVVKDGKVVLVRGYGIKNINGTEKNDEKTLFGIASNSKAFTATALAMLVEEGKVKWDTPVREYLPWFQMSNQYVTNEITVRDLLVHRSGLGLGAGDLLWWPSSLYSRKEICSRLKNIPLATSFRSAYAYDNVLYIVAGEVIEAVSGMSWEDFISKRILEKIGMSDTKVHPLDAVKNQNTAIPHAMVEGKLQVVKPFVNDNVNPAGGITSSARDMAKWLIVHLDSGKIDNDTRLFKQSATKQLWQYITPTPISNYKGELSIIRPNFAGYALGFQVKDYFGHKVVTHTGAYPGYLSQLTMIPDLKLGVVVLTNQESGYAFSAVTYKILEGYINTPKRDWLKLFSDNSDERDAKENDENTKTDENRKKNTHPSLDLDSYVGNYTDKWYGDMSIVKTGDKLEIQFAKTPSLKGELTHWHYDTFVARWYDRELSADSFVTFSLKSNGAIDQVKIVPVSSKTDFSFDFQDLLFEPSGK